MTILSDLAALDESSFDSVLCVVAHPDDIEYGMAAAVAAWTGAGKTVRYFLLTRGEAGIDTMDPIDAAPARADEERASAAVVGVESVEFGDHPDGTIEYGLRLRRDIAAAIRRAKPDLVLTLTHAETFAGGHLNQADHRAVGLATLDASADAGNRWIFPELIDEGLEPWKVTAVGVVAGPTPTHYVDVTGHLDDAIESLEEHRLYNAALPEDFPSPAELLGNILGMGAERVRDPMVTHALLVEHFPR
ncbi:PIG-L family deacetylase [Janibacter cremeus]|uniref:PIG-L deacetylase family protein n=1 Tax=Janibacter cremeus TaxID=1285192 RepID=UPI0023F88B16|nr:PIG-L deacetylase family protein [Janibacter cremeus]WEV78109.1 PIG-L family deacetylase [Janibacter cremeus]